MDFIAALASFAPGKFIEYGMTNVFFTWGKHGVELKAFPKSFFTESEKKKVYIIQLVIGKSQLKIGVNEILFKDSHKIIGQNLH